MTKTTDRTKLDEYEYTIGYTVIKTGQSDLWDKDWIDDREEAEEWVDTYEREWVGMVERGYTKSYEARLVKRRKAGPVVDA